VTFLKNLPPFFEAEVPDFELDSKFYFHYSESPKESGFGWQSEGQARVDGHAYF
jgi:hypothetical protein